MLLLFSTNVIADGSIDISPENNSGLIGEFIEINITANNVNNLFGYQFELGFDSSIIEFDEVVFSDLLGNSNEFFCTSSDNWIVESEVLKNVACTRIVSSEIDPANGVLATVIFNALTTGSSDLTLQNVIVSDYSSNEISVNLITPSGTINICESSPICAVSADCDDSNPSTTDLCLNGGTCIASCSNIDSIDSCIEGIISSQCICNEQVYSTGFCCASSYLAEAICSISSDCDDDNPCTTDSCFEENSCTSQCVNTPIADCGVTQPICGDGICDSLEDEINCSEDCSTTSETPPSPDTSPNTGSDTSSTGNTSGGGGSSGGGSATGSEGYKALTRELDLGELKINQATKAKIKVSHGFPSLSGFKLQLHIKKGEELVFYTEKSTGLISGGRTMNFEFDKAWTPTEEGDYEVTVVLSTTNKKLNYDIQTFTYSIGNTDQTTSIADSISQEINDVINPDADDENSPIATYDEVVDSPTVNLVTQLAPLGLIALIAIGIIIFIIQKK